MLEQDILQYYNEVTQRYGYCTICVLGGTFDPIHVGHTALAQAASDAVQAHMTLYIPAGIPSFKRDKHIVEAAHRLAMVKLATEDLEHSFVSACEVERDGITYTYDTFRMLSQFMPNAKFMMALGSDAYATLPIWYKAKELAKLTGFVWVARAYDDAEYARRNVAESGINARSIEVHTSLPDVSSTVIRECLASDHSVSKMLDPKVESYIKQHKLYTSL